MNICFVYPTLFHPIRGGVERVTDILAKEFIRRGHNVFYLNNKPDNELMDYDYPAPVYFFPQREWREPANIPFYHSFLKEHKIDIVINQCGNFDDSILYLDVPEGVKTISVMHMNPTANLANLFATNARLRNTSIAERTKQIARILFYPKIKQDCIARLRQQIDFLSHKTDIICLLSSFFKEELTSLCNENNRDKVLRKTRFIPNPNTYENNPHSTDSKENILLYVGRLDSGQKRPDRLVDIWKELYKDYPDWRMVLVGDGSDRCRIEKMSQGLERFSLIGFQNPEPWYKKASIFCMTSNFEGWGMVLTEAMCFGVIPFAFDSYAAVHDIISDGKNGYLVQPFSIDEYVAKLRIVMDDANLRSKISKAGLDSVTRFSATSVGDSWETLFKELYR